MSFLWSHNLFFTQLQVHEYGKLFAICPEVAVEDHLLDWLGDLACGVNGPIIKITHHLNPADMSFQ